MLIEKRSVARLTVIIVFVKEHALVCFHACLFGILFSVFLLGALKSLAAG